MLLLSPHLDDAVFGCGQWLAAVPGAAVVTVFAGSPGWPGVPTPWDAACGFGPEDDVMAARRAEDAAALCRLGATPRWLPFLDAQYGATPEMSVLAAALETVVRGSAAPTIAIPLGLFHSDHALVHAAALIVLQRCPERRWIAWEEPMYRRIDDLRERRLASLAAGGVIAEPACAIPAGDLDWKRDAVHCYRSQLRALDSPGYPGSADVFAPERYWTLRSPVNGGAA